MKFSHTDRQAGNEPQRRRNRVHVVAELPPFRISELRRSGHELEGNDGQRVNGRCP